MAIETNPGLRERRLLLGLTRQQLAAAAECSLSSIALFEGGYSPLYSQTRDRVEQALDELEARCPASDGTENVLHSDRRAPTVRQPGAR